MQGEGVAESRLARRGDGLGNFVGDLGRLFGRVERDPDGLAHMFEQQDIAPVVSNQFST